MAGEHGLEVGARRRTTSKSGRVRCMGKNDREGIVARKASVRIIFWYDGKRYFETLRVAPTPANLKYANSVRKEILRRIEIGTFQLVDFFPDSNNANKESEKSISPPLFREVVENWLESKKRGIKKATLQGYQSAIETHFMEPFGNRRMDTITFMEIDSLMSSLDISNKSFNNYLSILRSLYAYAVKASENTGVTVSLAEYIDFVKKEASEPDPLNRDEMAMVIQDMREHYDEQIEIYFSLAFLTGFRPSEGIDLRWSNIDWNKKEILISSAKVRGSIKCTKTDKARIVELDDECISLLLRLKKHTFMKGDVLFVNLATDKPYFDTRDLVGKYWRPSLKRCKIRDRDARQTRHTCASMMLMAGCKPAWAANRLGNSVEMFLRVYSKWIPENDKRQELSKMSGMYKPAAIKLAMND